MGIEPTSLGCCPSVLPYYTKAFIPPQGVIYIIPRLGLLNGKLFHFFVDALKRGCNFFECNDNSISVRRTRFSVCSQRSARLCQDESRPKCADVPDLHQLMIPHSRFFMHLISLFFSQHFIANLHEQLPQDVLASVSTLVTLTNTKKLIVPSVAFNDDRITSEE